MSFTQGGAGRLTSEATGASLRNLETTTIDAAVFLHQDWSQIKNMELRLWAIVTLLDLETVAHETGYQFAFQWKFADILP